LIKIGAPVTFPLSEGVTAKTTVVTATAATAIIAMRRTDLFMGKRQCADFINHPLKLFSLDTPGSRTQRLTHRNRNFAKDWLLSANRITSIRHVPFQARWVFHTQL